MQEMEIPVAVKQPRTSRAGCCPDDECGICGGSLKNNYYAGKRLTPDTFRVEQRYHVERRRLLNRAIHGWGVVYGYPITVETRELRKSSTRERPRRDPCGRRDDEPRDTRDGVTRRLKIEDGLALDTCGRELLQVGCTMLALTTSWWSTTVDGGSIPRTRSRPPWVIPRRSAVDGVGCSRRTTPSRTPIPSRSPIRAAASTTSGTMPARRCGTAYVAFYARSAAAIPNVVSIAIAHTRAAVILSEKRSSLRTTRPGRRSCAKKSARKGASY